MDPLSLTNLKTICIYNWGRADKGDVIPFAQLYLSTEELDCSWMPLTIREGTVAIYTVT